ncbi:OadG family protein [Cellvibrio sp. NN19]|uniref:OadG family protein n=1 Tax=Cellvibrio chitinivorans TaxID=3102792 RepID=UPI002B411CB7|nr:OadG family transporter subunit [Cellvibrio sp. NN19]
MQSTLFEQALDLLVFGMGTVFIFLAILVVAINLMSRFVSTFFPEAIAVEPMHQPKSTNDKADIDSTTLAAIQAAIHQHREKHPRA